MREENRPAGSKKKRNGAFALRGVSEIKARELPPSRTRSRFSIVFFLLFLFLFLVSPRFPSNLSVARISAGVRALWMARVSPAPHFSQAACPSAPLLVPRERYQPDRRVSLSSVRPAGDFQSQLSPPRRNSSLFAERRVAGFVDGKRRKSRRS